MKILNIAEELNSLAYHGRGIIIGKSADGKKAVTAYFIMGRSENSRNRVFVAEGDAMRTKAFDESKMTDPHLIIYYPVRVLGNKTMSRHSVHASLRTISPTLPLVFRASFALKRTA